VKKKQDRNCKQKQRKEKKAPIKEDSAKKMKEKVRNGNKLILLYETLNELIFMPYLS
jgi:hypothetical protein